MNDVDANRTRSQEVRSRRRIVRAEIRLLPVADGKAAVARLLVERPDWMSGTRVADALMWPDRMAERKAEDLCLQVGIGALRTVRELTDVQVGALAALLVGAELPETPTVVLPKLPAFSIDDVRTLSEARAVLTNLDQDLRRTRAALRRSLKHLEGTAPGDVKVAIGMSRLALGESLEEVA